MKVWTTPSHDDSTSLPFLERFRGQVCDKQMNHVLLKRGEGHPTIGTICYISSMERGNKATTNSYYSLKAKAGILEAKFDQGNSFASAKIPANFHVHSKGLSSSAFLESQPRLQHLLQGEQPPASYPIASIVNGMNFVLIELASLSQLSQVSCATKSISFGLENLDQGWNRNILGAYFFVVVGHENGVTKVRARMIESEIGEDPATGSAASDLSCYLISKEAQPNLVRRFEIEQGVEMGRRSVIRVRVELDNSAAIKQVDLSGQAVQIQKGQIFV